MSNAANSNRNSRIDILRTVSMLMIVTCHFIYHGIRHVTEGDTFPDLGFSASLTGEINFFFCQLLGYLTNIGPNLFILITGYFLIKPRDFRYALRKALHLWLVIVFYSLASLLAASLLTGGKAFSSQELLACILPVWSRQYWFMTMYLPLLLLSPFLAKGASALTKRDYQWLLLVLLILNFALSGVGYGPVFLGPVPLPFYIFVFLIGGYFQLYGSPARYVQYGIYVYLLGYLALAAVGTVAQLHFAPAGTFPHIKGMANNSITLFMSVLVFAWGYHPLPKGNPHGAMGHKHKSLRSGSLSHTRQSAHPTAALEQPRAPERLYSAALSHPLLYRVEHRNLRHWHRY